MTLLQSIQEFIDNISVTDRQEEDIQCSLDNLNGYLLDKSNNLGVSKTFAKGSYERDTIIRPLNDIDIFAVLKKDYWEDENGNLPTPQKVLSKLKDYLNSLPDYEDKVSQDRPCVTIELSKKDFDILPSFEQNFGGYLIPNYDLKSWTFSDPEKLTSDLNQSNKLKSYKVKPTIKAIKNWNRDSNNKLIPSHHIEETAIKIFSITDFKNYEESIRNWFDNAEYYLHSAKFKSYDNYSSSIKKIKATKEKLVEAKEKYDDGCEKEAQQIWKDIFGREFPSVGVDEAKNFSKSLLEGSLKIASSGLLSKSADISISASKGFYGDFSK